MIKTKTLSWIYWNPSPDAFTLPFTNHPVRWYGIFFALGFIIGYWIFQKLIIRNLKEENILNLKEIALLLTDRLAWFVVGGTIIGSRLGHVFFYDWPRYKEDPISIFKIWEGGLASHGGVIGILLALFFYKKIVLKNYRTISYLNLLDLLCIPTAFAAFCIRLGNFMNQEILGIESDRFFTVLFGNPADRSALVPRHPVQLYEAFSALFTFILLINLWKLNPPFLKKGVISGLFFILIFGSRFLIEFLKLPSSSVIDETMLQAGQILSIPCIIGGFLLLFRALLGKEAEKI